MVIRKFAIVTMGLAMMAGLARASITYQASQGTFASQSGTDGLTISPSLITFTGGFTDGTDTEYIDPATLIEFLAFNSSGSTAVAFASTDGGQLNTTAGSGDSIEVIFPSAVDYGFGFNFITAFAFETLCVDISTASFGNCDSGGTFILANTSGFVGALNDNPTPAALTTLWLHPSGGGNAGTDIQSFEVATQSEATTPEGPTMLLIGGGLIAIHLYRRRRQPLAC